MASGLLVVAARRGGADELVDEGGSGLLVPPNDPAALAGAIGRLLGDAALRTAMGRANQARAQRDFTIQRMLSDYEGLDMRLHGQKRSAAGV